MKRRVEKPLEVLASPDSREQGTPWRARPNSVYGPMDFLPTRSRGDSSERRHLSTFAFTKRLMWFITSSGMIFCDLYIESVKGDLLSQDAEKACSCLEKHFCGVRDRSQTVCIRSCPFLPRNCGTSCHSAKACVRLPSPRSLIRNLRWISEAIEPIVRGVARFPGFS